MPQPRTRKAVAATAVPAYQRESHTLAEKRKKLAELKLRKEILELQQRIEVTKHHASSIPLSGAAQNNKQITSSSTRASTAGAANQVISSNKKPGKTSTVAKGTAAAPLQSRAPAEPTPEQALLMPLKGDVCALQKELNVWKEHTTQHTASLREEVKVLQKQQLELLQ